MKARLLRHFGTADPVIARIVAASKPYGLSPARIRRSGHASAFEVLTRSIASQQLSGVAAARIIERIIALHGGRFPEPPALAQATPEALRATGLSFAKIAAVQDLAQRALDGRLPDDATLAALDDESVIEHCVAVRGIGRWTAQMLLMFHLGRTDVLPVDDYGVRNGFRLAYGLKGLPLPRALAQFGARWQPWRSAAAWYLWRAVEMHQAGTLAPPARPAPRVAIAKQPAR